MGNHGNSGNLLIHTIWKLNIGSILTERPGLSHQRGDGTHGPQMEQLKG